MRNFRENPQTMLLFLGSCIAILSGILLSGAPEQLFTLSMWVLQLALAGLGIYVSVSDEPRRRASFYCCLFVVLTVGIAGQQKISEMKHDSDAVWEQERSEQSLAQRFSTVVRELRDIKQGFKEPTEADRRLASLRAEIVVWNRGESGYPIGTVMTDCGGGNHLFELQEKQGYRLRFENNKCSHTVLAPNERRYTLSLAPLVPPTGHLQDLQRSNLSFHAQLLALFGAAVTRAQIKFYLADTEIASWSIADPDLKPEFITVPGSVLFREADNKFRKNFKR